MLTFVNLSAGAKYLENLQGEPHERAEQPELESPPSSPPGPQLQVLALSLAAATAGASTGGKASDLHEGPNFANVLCPASLSLCLSSSAASSSSTQPAMVSASCLLSSGFIQPQRPGSASAAPVLCLCADDNPGLGCAGAEASVFKDRESGPPCPHGRASVSAG